jgi:hypothetical protein
MGIFISIGILLIAYGLLLWLSIYIKKYDFLNEDTITIYRLIIFIGAIFFIPIIIIPTNIFSYLETKGQIGDSIGGFTAPLIGGLNAILVYMAFKQQIKANEFLKRFEEEKMIIDAINWLKEDKYEIRKLTEDIEKYAKDFERKIIEIPF